jgi:MoaA/NifB/PqqE/SkfB family radical SAM enzyme
MYYSKLKILHHREKIDSLMNFTITAPIHIRIKPTNICNHNCSYCSYQNSYGQLGKDMNGGDFIPYSKMVEIMNDCIDMKVKAITFSGGGEPLMYRNIDGVFRHLYGNKIKLGMLTNGILLSDELAKIALKCCTWIRISMDGWDPKSYAEYRGCPESNFDRLMDNIRKAVASKSGCVIGVNIIVDGKNAEHLYDMVKMVYELGVRSIKISPCIVSNSREVNNEIHSTLTPIVMEQLRQIESAGIDVYNSYHLQLEGFKKDYTWCPYIQILPIIGADQNVYTCHDKAYNKDTGLLGSIKDKSFKEFWFDGSGKFYKIDPSIHCNHHCITDCTNKMLLEYMNVVHKEFA